MNVPNIQIQAVPTWVWLAAGGALLLVYAKGAKATARDVSAGLVEGAIGAAGGLVEGTVKGLGAAVGVPDTNTAKCQDAQLFGTAWEVSK